LRSFPPSASDCRKPEILNTEGETIRSFLERDHQRLDQLLTRASGDLDNIDMEAFGEFRRGLLKHVGMEEKILLPAIQQLRGGEPLPIAARLRLDHGAIAALLLLAVGLSVPDDADANRRTAFDRVADVLEAHVDMSRVAALAGLEWNRAASATKFR